MIRGSPDPFPIFEGGVRLRHARLALNINLIKSAWQCLWHKHNALTDFFPVYLAAFQGSPDCFCVVSAPDPQKEGLANLTVVICVSHATKIVAR